MQIAMDLFFWRSFLTFAVKKLRQKVLCNGAQVIISFLEIEQGTCNSPWLWSLGSLGRIWHELMDGLGNYLAMVRHDMQDILHRCQLCVEISGG